MVQKTDKRGGTIVNSPAALAAAAEAAPPAKKAKVSFWGQNCLQLQWLGRAEQLYCASYL